MLTFVSSQAFDSASRAFTRSFVPSVVTVASTTSEVSMAAVVETSMASVAEEAVVVEHEIAATSIASAVFAASATFVELVN